MSERLKKKTARVARWLLQLRAEIDRAAATNDLAQAERDFRTLATLMTSARELIGADATAELMHEIQRDHLLAQQSAPPAGPGS